MISPEAAQSVPPTIMAQNGADPGEQLEPLGPSMFTRVEEPDSDGQVYNIEILTQAIGSRTAPSFPSLLTWLQDTLTMTTRIGLRRAHYLLELLLIRTGREWSTGRSKISGLGTRDVPTV